MPNFILFYSLIAKSISFISALIKRIFIEGFNCWILDIMLRIIVVSPSPGSPIIIEFAPLGNPLNYKVTYQVLFPTYSWQTNCCQTLHPSFLLYSSWSILFLLQSKNKPLPFWGRGWEKNSYSYKKTQRIPTDSGLLYIMKRYPIFLLHTRAFTLYNLWTPTWAVTWFVFRQYISTTQCYIILLLM